MKPETELSNVASLDSKAAQVVQLRPKSDGPPVGSLPDANGSSQLQLLAEAYERFQLQIRLDVEEERELLYKSLLVVEVLVLLFVLREYLVRWLA